jgi:hypothetical protein
MTGLLRHALVRLDTNTAHKFAAGHALVHYESGAIYSFIPKNGCSTMRYSLALANNCIAGPEDWTWIHPNNGTFSATLSDLVRAPFSYVILCCPHARLASVFLDKIVDKTPELWQLYRLTGDGFDSDTLTFRDFVTLIAEGAMLRVNVHWRPQVDFLVYESYSKVFLLETFDVAIRTLKNDIGFDVHDARHLTKHGTDVMTLKKQGAFADMALAELSAMKRGGALPDHTQLYDDDLARQVAEVYADDLAPYAAHLNTKQLTFPALL